MALSTGRKLAIFSNLAAEIDGLAELERDRFCGADLHDVKVQALLAALEIAAAGGHNRDLSIAKSLQSLLSLSFSLFAVSIKWLKRQVSLNFLIQAFFVE